MWYAIRVGTNHVLLNTDFLFPNYFHTGLYWLTPWAALGWISLRIINPHYYYCYFNTIVNLVCVNVRHLSCRTQMGLNLVCVNVRYLSCRTQMGYSLSNCDLNCLLAHFINSFHPQYKFHGNFVYIHTNMLSLHFTPITRATHSIIQPTANW